MSNTNMFGNWYDTEIGSNILSKKYFHHDLVGKTGLVEMISRLEKVSPENDPCFEGVPFFKSVTKQSIGELIKSADFLPAGSILYSVGMKERGIRASTSNCYIIPNPTDDMEGIMKSAYEMAKIFASRGGVGINISDLRPRDAKVNNAALTSTGAVSFMKIFDTVSEVIGSNGRR